MSAPKETNETNKPGKITPVTYLVLNLIFWAFCLVQYLAAKYYLGNIEGISMFFAALAIGFTAVCFFDWICGSLDKSAPEPSDERG